MIDIRQEDFYNIETDNMYEEVENGKPKYIEYNGRPVLYEVAVINAQNELKEMFKNVNSYEEARQLLVDNPSICSAKNGYCVADGYTGNLYCSWIVVWGNDNLKVIEYDVRWY
jgi:hypothetical protein